MGTIAKVTAGGATHLVASTAYGTCSTAAATAAKVATIQDSQAFTLMTGVTVHIYMTNANTVANPTLNVNSTGAKPIYRYGTTVPGTSAGASWQAGSVVTFTYNTTANTNGCWTMNDWLNDNTNNAVTQTATTTNANYEVLFSVTADNTTRTEGARKNTNLLFNPSTGNLQATQLNGVAIGTSPKFTDTNTHYTTHLYAGSGTAANAATTNGNTKITLVDDSTVRNSVTLKGTGGTTVVSDANGVITINSTSGGSSGADLTITEATQFNISGVTFKLEKVS